MLNFEEEQALRRLLLELCREHSELDASIERLVHDPHYDQFQLIRLKKRKLQLKDSIRRMQSRLIPDMNA